MDLETENAILKECLKETVWMARRYCNLRSTYGPSVVNKIIDTLLGMKVNIEDDVTIGRYAKDGMLGNWDPAAQLFEREIKKYD